MTYIPLVLVHGRWRQKNEKCLRTTTTLPIYTLKKLDMSRMISLLSLRLLEDCLIVCVYEQQFGTKSLMFSERMQQYLWRSAELLGLLNNC